MTEFKQIVGRGTRVHEDTRKFYFTLIDFRGATAHFADPDFDGTGTGYRIGSLPYGTSTATIYSDDHRLHHGRAELNDGQLVPNTEFGHLQREGRSWEKYAASSVKDKKGLSYPEWAARLQEYYSYLEFLLSPDVIIVGGGISRKSEKFLPLLTTDAEIIPAQLRNTAGIVGAAIVADERFRTGD